MSSPYDPNQPPYDPNQQPGDQYSSQDPTQMPSYSAYGSPVPEDMSYGSVNPTEKNGMGIAALIFGILSFLCLGIVGGVIAVILGTMNVNAAKEGRATNGKIGNVGRILGIIGSILSIVGGIYYISR